MNLHFHYCIGRIKDLKYTSITRASEDALIKCKYQSIFFKIIWKQKAILKKKQSNTKVFDAS